MTVGLVANVRYAMLNDFSTVARCSDTHAMSLALATVNTETGSSSLRTGHCTPRDKQGRDKLLFLRANQELDHVGMLPLCWSLDESESLRGEPEHIYLYCYVSAVSACDKGANKSQTGILLLPFSPTVHSDLWQAQTIAVNTRKQMNQATQDALSQNRVQPLRQHAGPPAVFQANLSAKLHRKQLKTKSQA